MNTSYSHIFKENICDHLPNNINPKYTKCDKNNAIENNSQLILIILG